MRWEYATEIWPSGVYRNKQGDFTQLLNDYGAAGWELANITSQVEGSDGSCSVDYTLIVFKRPAK